MTVTLLAIAAAVLALPGHARAQELPLEPGDTGPAVERWQTDLNLLFRMLRSTEGPMIVDGVFGPETEEATREFQRIRVGLSETGRVDRDTRAHLNDALATFIATPFTRRGLEWPLRVPQWFWPWARWYLGRSEFQDRRRDPAVRPPAAPRVIPRWAWRRMNVLNGRSEEARADRLAHDRVHAVYGSTTVVTGGSIRSERDPYWMLVWGRAEDPSRNWAAWLRMREGRWVPWQITHLGARPEPNLDPTGAPCDVKPAYSEPRC